MKPYISPHSERQFPRGPSRPTNPIPLLVSIILLGLLISGVIWLTAYSLERERDTGGIISENEHQLFYFTKEITQEVPNFDEFGNSAQIYRYTLFRYDMRTGKSHSLLSYEQGPITHGGPSFFTMWGKDAVLIEKIENDTQSSYLVVDAEGGEKGVH